MSHLKPLFLNEQEFAIILSMPLAYDMLHAKMVAENIGTPQRRNEISNYAFALRQELGV